MQWAIVSFMLESFRYGKRSNEELSVSKTTTVIQFYDSEEEARELFRTCPQGQSFASGEVKRLLLKVVEENTPNV